MIGNVLSFFHMLSLDQEACEVYCREKRLERYERYGGHIRFLKLHTLAHYFFIPLLKIDRMMKRQKLVVCRDLRKKSTRPIIFCPTHIGGMDVEMAIEAIGVPCWPLVGDPRELYKTITGMMLQMNGCIVFDVPYKQDRIAAKEQMKALLNKGGALLIFPEGVQNISPNVLINRLYPGAVELAIECGAEIIPVVLLRDGNVYYCSMGENVAYSGRDSADIPMLAVELRDQMATLLWDIMERQPVTERHHLSPNARQDFVNNVLALDKDYTWGIDDIIKGLYRPKGITEPNEAFSFLERIVIGKHNAFLVRDILKYKKNAQYQTSQVHKGARTE